MFTKYIEKAGHDGKLDFDLKEGRLVLDVTPSSHAVPNANVRNTDTKALSGGERSYSTMSFVLSLSDAVESPFRCLDEFDIFMVSLVPAALRCGALRCVA